MNRKTVIRMRGSCPTHGQLEITSGSREPMAIFHAGMEANPSLSLSSPSAPNRFLLILTYVKAQELENKYEDDYVTFDATLSASPPPPSPLPLLLGRTALVRTTPPQARSPRTRPSSRLEHGGCTDNAIQVVYIFHPATVAFF